MDRESSLTLLRDTHTFPGVFEFVVVARATAMTSIVSAAVAAGGEGSRLETVSERHSAKGTYVSLHLHIHVERAEQVLDVYSVLQRLDGVLKTM